MNICRCLQAWSQLVVCSHRRCLDVAAIVAAFWYMYLLEAIVVVVFFSFLVAAVIAGMALACYGR